MNISKPENEDLRIAGEFIGMMNLVAQGYNPLKKDPRQIPADGNAEKSEG